MRAQRLVTARLILLCVGVKVAERSGQTVAAMLQRGSAERPQRVLQTLCQCHKALATEYDMRMLPAGEGQPEVIEPVLERHTGDADAVIGHVGEVGQPQPTRRMLLPEDDVLLGPVEGPPAADAPLQGPADPATDLGVTAPDLVENGHRPQARRALQQRHHLAVPNRSQQVRPSADARRFLLRGQPWILFYAIGGGSTEPGFGRGNRRRLGLAKTHVQPHLAIGDVAAGQAAILVGIKDPLPIRSAVTARKHGPERGRACRQIRDCSRATPSLRHASGDTFSSRSTPVSHPVCRAARTTPTKRWCSTRGSRPPTTSTTPAPPAILRQAIRAPTPTSVAMSPSTSRR